jgi:hypothetical protein
MVAASVFGAAVCLVYLWAMTIDWSVTPSLNGGATLWYLQHRTCAHTRGGWCHVWLQHQALAMPVARLVLLQKPCPGGCNGVGNCDATLGVCYCPAGETPSAVTCSSKDASTLQNRQLSSNR